MQFYSDALSLKAPFREGYLLILTRLFEKECKSLRAVTTGKWSKCSMTDYSNNFHPSSSSSEQICIPFHRFFHKSQTV